MEKPREDTVLKSTCDVKRSDDYALSHEVESDDQVWEESHGRSDKHVWESGSQYDGSVSYDYQGEKKSHHVESNDYTLGRRGHT